MDGLVGRGVELQAFDTLLGGLGANRPRAVVLAGEPGIGKSRMLAELGVRADRRGMLVLAGSASEFERDLPFWLFVDALDEYLRAVEPELLHKLDGDVRAELANLLPSWPAPAGEPGRGDPRYRAHRAVRRVLELLSGPPPLVLLLDDLHWADSGSVELISALLRRPPQGAVLIAMAMRPRQIAHRLAGGLDRAEAAGLVERIELGPLTLPEARTLLGSEVDGGAAAALYAESGGNPFYLRQLARTPHLLQSGAAARPAGDEVPPAVTMAMTEELALLGAGERRMLECAAVAGDPFLLELVASAAELSETAVAEALDVLQVRDLIRPTEAPRRFRFRHPLLRRAVYDAAPRAWRVGAHERIADALARRGVAPSGRVHHVVQAARRGDLSAVDLVRAAGDAVAGRAPGDAARWYAAAIDLLPDDAPGAAGLWTALGGALGAAGRLADARSALVRALALVPDEEMATRVALTADCARIEHTLGHHDAAHRRLMAALDRTGDAHPAESVTLMYSIAQDHLYRLEFGRAVEWSRSTRTAAVRLGDPQLLAEAATGLAMSAAFAGAGAEAESACAEAGALVDALTDEQIGHSPDPIASRLAAAELLTGRLGDAARHAERALAATQSVGPGHHVPVMYWAGSARTAVGRLPEAVALLDEAVEVARTSGNASMLGWILLARSAVAVALGDGEAGRALAQEGVEAHGASAGTLPAVWSRLVLASASLECGDAASAEQILIGDLGGESLTRVPGALRGVAYEILTRGRLMTGRTAEAESAAERARAWAGESGLATASAAADRGAAEVALHRGQPRRAAELAMAAARTAEDMGAVMESGFARQSAARALADAGEIEQAVRELQSVCALYDRCGAPRRRAEAERLLRKLGHRRVHHRTTPGDRTGGGIASLTERELQIARLVTDRRTNAEIAAELYLSRKTVESHVRNLFTKLAVGSRVDIARAVERHDRRTP